MKSLATSLLCQSSLQVLRLDKNSLVPTDVREFCRTLQACDDKRLDSLRELSLAHNSLLDDRYITKAEIHNSKRKYRIGVEDPETGQLIPEIPVEVDELVVYHGLKCKVIATENESGQLRVLILSGIQAFADVCRVAMFPQLTALDLSNTGLALEHAMDGFNEFCSALETGVLDSLETLHLSRNGLVGRRWEGRRYEPIFDGIEYFCRVLRAGYLPQLSELSLASNKLTGYGYTLDGIRILVDALKKRSTVCSHTLQRLDFHNNRICFAGNFDGATMFKELVELDVLPQLQWWDFRSNDMFEYTAEVQELQESCAAKRIEVKV